MTDRSEGMTALAPTAREPSEPRAELNFRSFSDLAELPAEPEWLWKGLIAEGTLTLLVGRPFAGKTMLVGGLLKAMEERLPFLGQETEEATALLITEEHAGLLRESGRHASLVRTSMCCAGTRCR